MADDFFDDDFNDPFDSIVSQFFGRPYGRGARKRYEISGEEESELGFVETNEKVFLILEIPGYNEKEISIILKDKKLEIHAKKIHLENVKDYLANKLQRGVTISKTLPSHVSTKNFSHTFKNGILEVAFDRK